MFLERSINIYISEGDCGKALDLLKAWLYTFIEMQKLQMAWWQ